MPAGYDWIRNILIPFQYSPKRKITSKLKISASGCKGHTAYKVIAEFTTTRLNVEPHERALVTMQPPSIFITELKPQ